MARTIRKKSPWGQPGRSVAVPPRDRLARSRRPVGPTLPRGQGQGITYSGNDYAVNVPQYLPDGQRNPLYVGPGGYGSVPTTGRNAPTQATSTGPSWAVSYNPQDFVPKSPVIGKPGGSGPGGTGVATPPAGPPESAETHGRRIAADEAYGRAGSDIRGLIYQSALNYGDPEVLKSLGAWIDPNTQQRYSLGPVVNNPNSQLSQIERAREVGVKNVYDRNLSNNTLFSSNRQTQDQNVSDTADRSRLQAITNYQDAVRELYKRLGTAWGDRANEYLGAGLTDLANARANEPEPGSEAPTSKGTGKGGTPTGSTKKPVQETPPKAAGPPRRQPTTRGGGSKKKRSLRGRLLKGSRSAAPKERF